MSVSAKLGLITLALSVTATVLALSEGNERNFLLGSFLACCAVYRLLNR